MRFIIVLYLAQITSATQADIVPDIIEFEKHWTPFLYKLAGCAMNRTFERPVCDSSKREIDHVLFLKARKAAAKVFDLREPK